ncbi:MAG TPA: hypothetical protein VN902_15750 [Candidatus Acidoferrales bacterium]|jgi:hypothetical protein|nr:hypothetical protein [Candidatus Acidoferrales bacterium]
MNRSVGVTVTAVIVLFGSGLTLLAGVMMLFASSSDLPIPENQVHFLKYFMVFLALVLFAAAAWGIASGTGLMRLREWSRISMLVFSALLLFVCIPGLLMFLFMPFPPPGTAPSPEMTKEMLAATRIFMAVLYGILAALGGWWIYFFNKRSTKDQFLKVRIPGLEGMPGAEVISPYARPLSITLIAWWLLISGFIGVLGLSVNPPVFFLGYFFKGTYASVLMLALALVQSLIGFGLLKLRPWGRTLAIYYFQFLIFNSLTMVLIPGTQARFEQAMSEMLSDMQGTLGTPPSPMHVPIWFGVIFAVPLLSLLLWIVVSRKDAFQAER